MTNLCSLINCIVLHYYNSCFSTGTSTSSTSEQALHRGRKSEAGIPADENDEDELPGAGGGQPRADPAQGGRSAGGGSLAQAGPPGGGAQQHHSPRPFPVHGADEDQRPHSPPHQLIHSFHRSQHLT